MGGKAEDLRVRTCCLCRRSAAGSASGMGRQSPGQGIGQPLWLVGKLGEVIDVIKKVDTDHPDGPRHARAPAGGGAGRRGHVFSRPAGLLRHHGGGIQPGLLWQNGAQFPPQLHPGASGYDKKYKLEKEPLVRYYVCSINPEDEGIAETIYRAVREHWHRTRRTGGWTSTSVRTGCR